MTYEEALKNKSRMVRVDKHGDEMYGWAANFEYDYQEDEETNNRYYLVDEVPYKIDIDTLLSEIYDRENRYLTVEKGCVYPHELDDCEVIDYRKECVDIEELRKLIDAWFEKQPKAYKKTNIVVTDVEKLR